MSQILRNALFTVAIACSVASCGPGTEADKVGVAWACADSGDCKNNLVCLPFKGGYCGLEGCAGNAGCPEGSACVAHTDGKNYCFRVCLDKPDCNLHRSADNEANCSSNVTFVDGVKGLKACVPPSAS